jgi:hypothetical protein
MLILKKYFYSSLFIIFLIGLAGYIYVGFSTLMWADDYCFMSVYKDGGFFRSLIHTYTSAIVIAGNRFAAMIVVSLFGYVGAKLVPIFPLLTILGLFLSLTFLIKHITWYFIKRRERLASTLVAGLLTNILIYIAPSHFQNFYWYSGIITYTTPLVIFIFLAGIFFLSLEIDNQRQRVGLSILMFFVAVFCAGFSETAAVAFFVGMIILTAYLMLIARREKFSLWKMTPVLGLIVGMVLLIISPSGRLRSTSTGSVDLNQWQNGLWMMTTTLKFGADFIRYALSGYVLPIFITVLSCASFGYLLKGVQNNPVRLSWNIAKTNIYLALSTYLIVAASIAPSVFAFSGYPNLRSRLIGTFFLLCGIALISFYNGYNFHLRAQSIEIISLAVLALASVYVLRASWVEQDYRVELQTRRELWIQRDKMAKELIQSGKKYVTMPAIDSLGEGIDTLGDFNHVCFRKYYGFINVKTTNDWPSSP